MSPRNVRKHIRQQRRERRRAVRDQERAAKLKVKQDAAAARTEPEETELEEPGPQEIEPQEIEPAEVVPEEREPQRTVAKTPAPSGRGRRVVAVVVTAGILLAGGGSLAANLTPSAAPLAGMDVLDVPAPGSGTHLVCPPMPGQPDSLTSDGLLDYADRDDSAAALFSALLFDADGAGGFPAASTATLTEQGREQGQQLAEPSEENTEDAEAPLAERETIYETVSDLTDPTMLELTEGSPGAATAAAALYEYQADAGPVTGLALGTCTAPQRSQWFFGPELGAGATGLLTLANPHEREATVEVSSVDSDGARPGSGTRSLVVPGQSVRSLNIAAIAGSSDELGVQVETSGAPVNAQLQSSRAVGLTGQGTELLPGSEEPAEDHRMPGVPMPDTGEGADQDSAELWVHAPGEDRTTIELQVFGPDGQIPLENPSVFTVEGGEVDTVSLAGMEAGVYDVVVQADRPVHSAVKSYGTGEDPEPEDEAAEAGDFSWMGPAEPLEPGSGALLPAAGETELRLFSTGGSGTASYRLLHEDGTFSEAQQVEMPGDQGVTLGAEELDEVSDDAVAVVFDEVDAGIHAGLLTTDDTGRFSTMTVGTMLDTGQTVPVRLR